MRRYYIRSGDKTTAGGVVAQAEERFKHNGIPVAYSGAEIYCHTCKSVGYIQNVPPYRPFGILGKQIALEGDICVCKCNPPPRLIASQNTASMSFDEEELRRMGLTADGKPLVAASPASVFDDRFQILDASTGEPIANAEYAIERANGEVEHGITYQHGRTHLLTATEQAEVVHIYV
ncbi:PAAR domain-containing protein [Ralstonia solanacearum]|uniref:PAAR domain-containing protein n=1 Tax=Ralstonia pseudosolanacearum TaxID=1310165 RepID=UPI00090357C4|nr:PAAR domain-containing protein [Ralstonia pseudosolanacearum]QKL70687.1 PAAR domain-containing protein [Ralstonia solanacearum]MCK4145970.1 PAAR domain-containing protein [Ralstonia pseudosolanacearum]MCK4161191.1 PAAR domain-containing protein [Ralstonia pseudosolanacearum]QKL75898.1 PAAR domain-containing protein [Ralstonia solanacearum]QKL81100.1 PAAR domain-containing protein [Ralstonia solanacearum]